MHFSIVVGTNACNAKCPFCISRMTGNTVDTKINWRRFETACRLAKNATTALLTGVGEPTLYHGLIDEYLRRLTKFNFPITELQTNGALLKSDDLKLWYKQGLQLVSLSVTDHDPVNSARLMGLSKPFDYWKTVEALHLLGFSVRINCTLLRAGVRTFADIYRLVDRCRDAGVAQLTLREVATPSGANGPMADYCRAEHVGILQAYEKSIELYAPLLLELPHGGRVYDIDGQNVCISNCMTTDPKEIRSIIFFPDGAIRYDWQHKGARIL